MDMLNGFRGITNIIVFFFVWAVNMAALCTVFIVVRLIARRIIDRPRSEPASEETVQANEYSWRHLLIRPLPISFLAVFLLIIAFNLIDPLRAWWFISVVKTTRTTDEYVWKDLACYHLKNKGGARCLARTALDHNSSFRQCALNALVYDEKPLPLDIRDEVVIPTAAQVFHEQGGQYRRTAVKVLAYVKPRCSQQLSVLADNIKEIPDDCMVIALGAIDGYAKSDPDGRSILAKVLNDPDPRIRHACELYFSHRR
jgi:hypothetical protein